MIKIPSAGTPVSLGTLVRAFIPAGGQTALRRALQVRFGMPWCGLAGSGTAAVYACLLVLKKRSDRTRVILPAYTAPSLILPIRKAGLIPALCDISTETLNAGPEEMLPGVDRNVLAVMPVHMFGLPTDVPAMTRALCQTGTAVIEDAASAMGAQLAGTPVGNFGDIGIFSFNRGKNLATYTGGALLTRHQEWVPDLEAALKTFPQPDFEQALKIRIYASALALVVHPLYYTVMHPLIARFKYTTLHTDFHTWAYTDFQARLGHSLLRQLDIFTTIREANGRFLRKALLSIDGVRLPRLFENARPAYNQFPLLLPDEAARESVHQAILETGLEVTTLYPDPIHRLYPDFWDGMGPDPFPNATAVARRLLLLPVHPLVPRRALERAVEVIQKTLK